MRNTLRDFFASILVMDYFRTNSTSGEKQEVTQLYST
jgi:hypothetical protein